MLLSSLLSGLSVGGQGCARGLPPPLQQEGAELGSPPLGGEAWVSQQLGGKVSRSSFQASAGIRTAGGWQHRA